MEELHNVFSFGSYRTFQRLSFLEAGTSKESKERIPKNLFLKTTAIGGRKWQN